MSEFNNRIDAQREILASVNSEEWREELYGLSRAAIDRWINANNIELSSDLPRVLLDLGGKLFFLANKSQEQVTNEYRQLSVEVRALMEHLTASLLQYKNRS